MASKYTLKNLLFSIKHPEKIARQYLDNLRVEFDCITSQEEKQHSKKIIDKIEQELQKSPADWFAVHKVQQYLSFVCGEEFLNSDLKRILVQCRRYLPAAICEHYASELDRILKEGTVKEKQNIRLKMYAEIHSYYVKRSECREYGLLTRLRVSAFFLVGIVIFLAALIYCHFSAHMKPASEMILIIFASGFLGATFSLLVGLKEHLAVATIEDLKIMHRQSYILKRAFLGVGGAVIAYFLIQSELLLQVLNEDLLPAVPVKKDPIGLDDYANISKLIIWSFIAGFSERLVPGLLNTVERRFSSSSNW